MDIETAKTKVIIELKNGKISAFLSINEPSELLRSFSDATKLFDVHNSALCMMIIKGVKRSSMIVNMNEIITISFIRYEPENASA